MAVFRSLPTEPQVPAEAQTPSGAIRRARHLLVVPEGVGVDEVDLLALSRFPSARWMPAPQPNGEVVEPGALRTSRHTVLVGPYARGGSTPGFVLDVVSPRERGERPHPADPDPDGLLRAFARGVPVREERRVVDWLVAVARRLAATVVFDGAYPVSPDPEASVNLTIFSDVWLDPEAAFATIQRVAPRVEFASSGRDWSGPPADVASRPLPSGVHEDLEPEERAALHAAADEVDLRALAGGPDLAGYALHVNMDLDGFVTVEIGAEEVLPASLQGLPWAEEGSVTYRLSWFPRDDHPTHDVVVHSNADLPLAMRVSRSRAAEQVGRIARALHAVTGGEIADDDDFLVSPEDL